MRKEQTFAWQELNLGTCYYPEHWDKDMWQSDARLMAQTGVKIVRLAEFAWCRLEPSDGLFLNLIRREMSSGRM